MLNPLALEELKKHKVLLGALVGLSLTVTLCIIGQAVFIAHIVNGFFLGNMSFGDGEYYFGGVVVIVAMRAFLQYLREKIALQLGKVTKQSLRNRLIEHMMAVGPLSDERQGETVHLLTEGLDNVEDYIARYIPQMLYSVVLPLTIAIAMMMAIPWVGIILLISYPLIPFFMILIGKKAGAMNEAQWEKMSFLSGHFLDVLQGLTTLKVFHRSREQKAVIARLAGEFRDATLKVLRIAFLSSFVLELAGTISTAVIAVYTGVALLYYKVDFLPAFFVLLLSPEFYLPLRELGSAFHTGMAGDTALKKGQLFLTTPIREPISGPIQNIGTITRISFDDVSYTYDAGGKEALINFSASLTKGQPVMLVGESGAGKSTVANILLRLLEIQKGNVIIHTADANTITINELDGNSWRDQIAYVPQKPYLFRGTIRDNIAFGTNASWEAIKESAIKAGAHEFIMGRAKGYDDVIGEGGLGLSGGEIQRIALARAFLHSGQILILDEVSAHLDVKTETYIGAALQRLMAEKLVLCIGHRVQTMRWVDRLLVMKEGRIVQQGSFSKLSDEEGFFKDLVREGGVCE